MRFSHRLAVLAAVASAAAGAALAAAAGPGATGWTRISGPTEPGRQLGLARTGDGVLHVIWNRGNSPTSIFESRVSPAGRVVGTSTVASGWEGNGGLALLVEPDGSLRLFAAGTVSATSAADGINTFTAPAAGGAWTLQSGVFWGGAVASSAGGLGATLTRDGQPVTAWRGFAAPGAPPASIPQDAYVPDQTGSLLATDAATGAVVLAGVTIAGKGGVFVRQILPSAGPAVTLPLAAAQNDWEVGVSGRIGAPGVFVAYADTRAARLYRYGGGSRTLASGPYVSATVCAGPAGRLWVAWGDRDGLVVTRSSRGLGSFEPLQRLKLPQGTTNGLTYLQCEGSAGPVDLFADVSDRSNQPGFWLTHVLARLTVRAAVAKTRVTVSVRDAGDPVAGASVTVAGKHLETDARGQGTVTLRPGSYTATVAADGYATSALRVAV